MYNRYVDGLATCEPPDAASYRERAERVASDGYLAIPAEVLLVPAGH
jgi:hypothetical protein